MITDVIVFIYELEILHSSFVIITAYTSVLLDMSFPADQQCPGPLHAGLTAQAFLSLCMVRYQYYVPLREVDNK